MAGEIDTLLLEKKAAAKVIRNLAASFRGNIAQAVHSTGASTKSTVKSKFKDNHLDRISFVSQDYIFKQNFGFEGTKKNGVNMRLKSTSVVEKSIDSTNALDILADELTDIRGYEVTNRLTFNRNG